MNPTYYNWFWLIGAGALLGLFLSTRLVVVIAACCLAIAIAGLVISAATSNDGKLTMLFGIAAMATPVVGAVAAVGTLLGNVIRSTLARSEK